MSKLENKKIAIVCDWLKDYGGAEMVIEDLLEIFPSADIYTSVFYLKNRKAFEGRNIFTSFIQKIPLLSRSHKLALTLRPQAFESFDLSWYDLVISSSSAESKGVITKPDTIHICYCHTPTRYFWSHYHEYLSMMEFWFLNPLAKWLMPKIVHQLRQWDFLASKRVDYFIANSENTAKRIWKYYKKPSPTIYPWIDIENVPFSTEKQDYYFYNGRCIPYKKFDLIVDTFNKNGKKIIICTNTKNKLAKKLQHLSNDNITWKFDLPNSEVNRLLSQAKWYIFPPEEDFWLAPLFALAAGTPVIAYGKWWALETVKSGVSGIFFDNQSVRSLNNALDTFETLEFDPYLIRESAKKFDKKIFQSQIIDFIENLL